MASNWTIYTFDGEGDFVRHHHEGVYAVFCDGVLTYVGESVNVAYRMRFYNFRYGFGGSVFTPWGQCDSLVVKVRRSRRRGDWKMIEFRLIEKLKPFGNVRGTGRKNRKKRASA